MLLALYTLVGCIFGLALGQTPPTSRPHITGIMGFRLGMTKAEAMHIAQQKGWTLESDSGDVLRADFIKTKHFSGLAFSSVSLTFAPSGLARIFIASPKDHYDKDKTLMNYHNAAFLQNIEDKYGLPDKLWYGHNGKFDYHPRGYLHLPLQRVPGEEYEYTSALELTWQSNGRRIWVGYFKKHAQVYSDKVFVGVFYEDDMLWQKYHEAQSRDY